MVPCFPLTAVWTAPAAGVKAGRRPPPEGGLVLMPARTTSRCAAWPARCSAAMVQNPLRRSTMQAADANDQAVSWTATGALGIAARASQRVGPTDPVSGSCTAGSRRSIASAWRRVESSYPPYRCRTKVRSSGVVMSAAAPAAERRSGPVRGRPNASRASVARQVNRQRSRYAGAVLRSLARSQQGRPTAHIQHLLRNSLTPLA
jgi:hypothetical protein